MAVRRGSLPMTVGVALAAFVIGRKGKEGAEISPISCGAAEALLGQERIGPVPILGRRIPLELENPRLVELVKALQRKRLVGSAAPLDRSQRLVPVAAAITAQHFDREVAQTLETRGRHHVLAA